LQRSALPLLLPRQLTKPGTLLINSMALTFHSFPLSAEHLTICRQKSSNEIQSAERIGQNRINSLTKQVRHLLRKASKHPRNLLSNSLLTLS